MHRARLVCVTAICASSTMGCPQFEHDFTIGGEAGIPLLSDAEAGGLGQEAGPNLIEDSEAEAVRCHALRRGEEAMTKKDAPHQEW
jgi:hypothetical protein